VRWHLVFKWVRLVTAISHVYNIMKNILRVLGIVLGSVSIFIGIMLLIHPVHNTIVEKINILTFLGIGVIIIIYGIFGVP